MWLKTTTVFLLGCLKGRMGVSRATTKLLFNVYMLQMTSIYNYIDGAK